MNYNQNDVQFSHIVHAFNLFEFICTHSLKERNKVKENTNVNNMGDSTVSPKQCFLAKEEA